MSCSLIVLVLAGSCLAQTPPLFNVRDFGATGNGVTIDTSAINAAIVAANTNGGGTVVFPAGTYFSVSIHLTNNVTLYLSNNAVILAATNGFDAEESNPYSQYQDIGHSYFHDALIWGEGLTNIAFAGPGTIDGGGGLQSGNPGLTQADKAIALKLCTNVRLTDITITRAGHFGILANGCSNMVVTGVQILNAYLNQHRDAFNLISSSSVLVSNCVIQGSDDAMVLKSDYALGRKINSHGIRISHCTILSTQNNATQFGSETVGDFSDVSWAHLQLDGAGKAGIGITSQDGSAIDGVTYDDVTMSNCACPIFLKLDLRTTGSPSPSVGRIRNISINNVAAVHSTFDGRTNTSTINGYYDTNGTTCIPIENITFNNVNVSNLGGHPASDATVYPPENQDWQPQNFGRWPSYGWYLRFARNISFTNCQTHFDSNDDRPAVVVDTATNILFDTLTANSGTASPYDMRFTNTLNFEVTNSLASSHAALRILMTNSSPALIAAPPAFNPPEGFYPSAQSVTLNSPTPGATIRYTTDGSTPGSTNGTSASGPVLITSETVLKAIASTNGFVDSAVNTAIYLIGSQGVAIPTFSPPAGTYAAAQSVTITSATGGASIRYTTNGATPSSTNGILYTGPVAISSNLTLKGLAYATNLAASEVNTATYTITYLAGTPTLNPPGGIYTNAQSVAMASATADASIRYTTDGSAPSSNSGTLYSSPVLIASNTTLNAIAYASGAADSQIAAITYTIVPAPPPPPTLAFEAELLSFVTNGAAAAVQTDVNSSGGKWMALEATTFGPWIDYTLPGIPAGTYHFKLMYKGNSGRGIISNQVDGLPLGGPLDQYSANQTYPELELGIVALSAGNHIVRQIVVGKNPAAGSPWASADKFTLIQIPPPTIGSVQVQGTNLVISGTNSISNGTGYLLASTNLSLAATNWIRVATNAFDVIGDFSFTNRVDPSIPQRFYRVLLGP